MPIYKGELAEFQERIYKGQECIRRVYKGTELVWGLYNVYYYDRSDMYEPNKEFNEFSIYAWGKQRWLPTVNSNTHFADYFESYQTHWFGWWDDYSYGTKRLNDKSYNFWISKKEHHNFNLYAKWTQKQFQWRGTIEYGEDPEPSSEGGLEEFPSKTERPTGGIYFEGGVGTCMPNCTYYVYYRAKEASGYFPTNGYGNAGQWWLDNAVEPWKGHETKNWADLKPGDIGVCKQTWNPSTGEWNVDGHVFMVETDTQCSNSSWTPGYGTEKWQDPNSLIIRDGRSARDIYNQIFGLGGYPGFADVEYKKGSTYGWRWWGLASTESASGWGGGLIGYLRYDGKWAPGGGKVTEEYDWTEDYLDQENPSMPDPVEIVGDDTAEWVDGPYERTNIRNWIYLETPQVGGDWEEWKTDFFDYWELGWDWEET